jgi:DNA-damage-inducible protein J
MSTAINMFLRQAVEFDGIPFVIQRRYNEETEQAIRDSRLGVGLSKPYNSVQELREDLDADD